MSMGKRVTLGTLGLLLAGGATLALASISCAPEHNPNYAGPPFVAQVVGFNPDDYSVAQVMYLPTADKASHCDDLDLDGGGGPQATEVAVNTAFRVVFSELVDADKVEQVDADGIGTALYRGLINVTNRDGTPVVSTLDPTLTLGPDAFTGVYQPAGGSGCFGTVNTVDIGTGAPIPGPALLAYMQATIPGLPSGSELTLVVDGTVPGHEIVDKGGAGLEGGKFKLDITTTAMTVDCPSLDACNVVPLPDPTAEADLGTMGFVQVGFTAQVADPAGVFLYEDGQTTPVAGVTAVLDANLSALVSETQSPLIVDLIAGTEADPLPLDLLPGATYTIVVTSAVLDPWGMAAQTIPDDTTCADAAVTVAGCVWAGSFTMPVPAADGGI
ncbi:MAG TPA: hypothetical protein VGQ83_08190 [Polyangia bacterium]|jgi:hypothetical protein